MTKEVEKTIALMLDVALGYVKFDHGDLAKDIVSVDKWEAGHPFLWAIRPTGTWIFDGTNLDADFCKSVLSQQKNRWFMGFVGGILHELDHQKVTDVIDRCTLKDCMSCAHMCMTTDDDIIKCSCCENYANYVEG